MGGSSSKPKTPPPPEAAPPPAAEDISEVIAPTLQQEAARRAASGAYTTKGQKMGAGGQILGASPKKLADVAIASGIYDNEIKESKIKATGDTGKFLGTSYGYSPFTVNQLRSLEEKGYKVSKNFTYENYLKQYNKRKERAEKARTQGGMTI